MTTPAAAASPCELRFEGGSVPDAWSEVSRDVTALVGQLTASNTDCRLISVAPDRAGATVVFETADGRAARRHIAAPAELKPMVEALLVFGKDPSPPPAVVSTALADPSAPLGASGITTVDPLALGARVAEPAKDAKQTVPRKDSPRLLLGAGVGVEGGWPRDTLGAVGEVFAGMSLARWELAAFGRWEVDAESDGSSGRLEVSAIGGGAMFGRRERVGPLVLIGGARAGLFDAEQEVRRGHDWAQKARFRDEFLDPRFGLYAGCIVSESSLVRFRFQVDADAGLVAHRSELPELPAFPRWHLAVSIGAETGFIP